MSVDNVENDAYAFYRRIGSPKFVVAPMVDQSELAFRLLTRKFGAHLVYTQMFNANSFINSNEYMEDNFTTVSEDRPLIVQFAGHDPDVMLQAAKYVENHCDAVDVNIGCPQGIAKRGRYGAFLMEELELLAAIVSKLKNGLKIPVTCKTRIYTDFDRTVRLCETLVNAGASLLCIHARTREQKGHTVGSADWPTLARLKKHFGNRIPIIANGGIRSVDDIYRCIEETGVDGVMTSEGILENPAMFIRNVHPSTGLPMSQLDITDEYLEMVTQYPAWHLRTVRSHIMKFLFRYFHLHTELREMVAMAGSVQEFKEVVKVCRNLVGDKESSYQDIWYDRYNNEKEDVNPKTRHNRYNKDARVADNLLDAESTCECGDGTSDVIFGFGIFDEES